MAKSNSSQRLTNRQLDTLYGYLPRLRVRDIPRAALSLRWQVLCSIVGFLVSVFLLGVSVPSLWEKAFNRAGEPVSARKDGQQGVTIKTGDSGSRRSQNTQTQDQHVNVPIDIGVTVPTAHTLNQTPGHVLMDHKLDLSEPDMVQIRSPGWAFWIGKYEITNREYREIQESEEVDAPTSFEDSPFASDEQPVAGVSYVEAKQYCTWLTLKTGKQYRLPTEAEWREAAFGENRRYPWPGDDLPESGGPNVSVSMGPTVSVKKSGLEANSTFGMGGNVAEWCTDTETPERAIAFGGCWKDSLESLERIFPGEPHSKAERVQHIGFRVARDAD